MGCRRACVAELVFSLVLEEVGRGAISMRTTEALSRAALTLSFLMLVGSTACDEGQPVDTSLLSGKPCEPPCWQGLTPGVSTEEEASEFVRISELVDRTAVYQSDLTLGTGEVVGVSMQWWSSANTARTWREHPNEFIVKDDVLQDIAVFLDYEVTLGDLLTRYGSPHRWEVQWVSLDTLDIDVMLYYPTRGFTARVRLPSFGVSLEPSSEVRQVRYLRPLQNEDFLSLGPQVGYFPVDEAESLREWAGYGPVNP